MGVLGHYDCNRSGRSKIFFARRSFFACGGGSEWDILLGVQKCAGCRLGGRSLFRIHYELISYHKMKLHLPSALRKAVLACLAAVALPATLPTTLGTASGIAAAWLLSSQTARADVSSPAPEQATEEDDEDEVLPIANGAVSWTTDSADATLTWDEVATGWAGGSAFADNDSVTFLGAGGTVTVGAAVTAGSLTIGEATTEGEGGGGATFTLTAGSAENAAANAVTVTGAVTLNNGYVLQLENVNFTAQGGLGPSAMNASYGTLYGTLVVGSGANATISGSIMNVNNAPTALMVHHLTVSGGTLTVTQNDTWVNTAWNNVPGATVMTEVTDGGTLITQKFITPHSVSVTGENSSMTVNGNAMLNNWGSLTVNGGGTMTITGVLSGNKNAAGSTANNTNAGTVTVGSHDDAGASTVGTLTLGNEGSDVSTTTHRTYEVKVYGTGSSLTVYGGLSAVARTPSGSSTVQADAALSVMYGAAATVSGTLTCEGASALHIGGEGQGNTGTLTVGGLTAGTVDIGAGSTLNLAGEVGVTQVNLGGTLAIAGAVTKKSDMVGKMSISIDMTGSGKLHLSSEAVGSLGSFAGLQLALSGKPTDTNWDYTLFDMSAIGGAAATAESLTAWVQSGVVRGYFRRALSVNANGQLHFDSSIQPRDLAWNESVSTWSDGQGTWDTGDADKTFIGGDTVTFGTPGEHSVGVSGTVEPGSISVKSGTWTFSVTEGGDPDAVVASGTMTVGGGAIVTFEEGLSFEAESVSVEAGSTLTLAGTATVAGGVTLGEDAKLVLGQKGSQTTCSWNFGEGRITLAAGSVVELQKTSDLGHIGKLNGNGNGEVVMNTGTAFDQGVLGNIIGGSDEASVSQLTISDGTGLVINSEAAGKSVLGAIKGEIVVKEGGALSFGAPAMGFPGLTVHIAGTGRSLKEGESDNNSTTSSYAALGLYNHNTWGSGNANSTSCTFKIVLDDDATVGVGNSNESSIYVNMSGGIDFAGYTLTKVGKGDLRLGGDTVAAEGGGTLDIAEGKVSLGTSAGDATFNAKKLAGIDVNVGEIGELHVNQNAEVKSLSGSGSVTFVPPSEDEPSKELTIVGDSAQEFTGTIEGESGNETVDKTVLQVHVGKGGALKLGAGAVVGNGVRVEGTLAITGGVTVQNKKSWTIEEGGVMDIGDVGDEPLISGRLTLRVKATSKEVGGRLRLSDSAMKNLQNLGGAEGLELKLARGTRDLDYKEDWTYHLFDTAGRGWNTQDALGVLKALLGSAYVGGGRRTLEVDENGVVNYAANLEELTWSGDANNTWKSAGNSAGGEMNWEEGGAFFTDGDSVNFDASVATPPEAVTVVGTVCPEEVTVKSGKWSFTGEEGADVKAASLRVEKGASAAIGGGLGLHVKGATVDGELHLGVEDTGALSLEAAEVGATGAIYLESSAAAGTGVWSKSEESETSETNISGDGKVVLGVDAEVKTVHEGDKDRNLFAALFAGGDTEAERDAGHAGIGTFEVAEGVTLTLGDVGKSVSLVRNMRVAEGGTLSVNYGVFDQEVAGYAQTGTITLVGRGVAEEAAARAAAEQGGGALVFNVSGGTVVKWDVVLEGDASIANEAGAAVHFAGGAELNAAGHRLEIVKGKFQFGDGAGNSFHAAEGSSGTLALAGGVQLVLSHTDQPTSFAGYDIELEEGATFTAQSDVTFRDVKGSGSMVVWAGKTLVLKGKVGAAVVEGEETEEELRSVELTLNGGTLSIQGTEASWVSAMKLSGEGASALELAVGAETDYASSGVMKVDSVEGSNELTLTLGGIQDYIDAHRNEAGWDGGIQLFTGGAVGGLYEMWKAEQLKFGGIIGYDYQLDETGKLTLTEITDEYTWTDTKHGSAHRLRWQHGVTGSEDGKWDGGVSYVKNGATVRLVGDTGEAVTVTVSGEVEAREVTIGGSSAFTFVKAGGGGSLHVVDMSVETDSTFNPEVTVERGMSVQAGKTATFTGGLATANGSKVELGEGATVKLVGDGALKAKVGREMSVSGNGNWEVDLSGASDQTYDGDGVTLGEGVKMRLRGAAGEGEEDAWSNVANLNVLGGLELTAGKQVVFTGTNRVGRLTAVYSNSADATNVGQLVLEGDDSTLSITGEGDTDLGHMVLDLRSGTFTQGKGTLTVGGLRSNQHSEGVLEVQNLAITAEDTWDIFEVGETGGQRGYSGSVHVAGNFTMNGKVWEEGNGGDAGTEGDAADPGGAGGDVGDVGGNEVGEDDYVQHLDGEVTVGGTAMVQSGVLDVGGSRFAVGEQLGVSGGQFKWHGGEMEVGSLNITGEGAVELAAGEVTVNGGISGDGGTLDIGAPIDESTGNEVQVQVTLKGEESASYAGEVKLGTGGTLAVESTGQVLQRMTAAGGELSVGDGKNLSVGALNDASVAVVQEGGARGLESVALGAGANWTVQGGSFTLTGPLTWGAGASITLEYAGEGTAPSILLGGEFNVGDGMTSDDKLTFNLSAEYLKTLEQVESDVPGQMKAHFLDNDRDGSSKWNSGYEEFFSVLADDDPWNYANLTLDSEGYLTWDVKKGATWREGADGGAGEWSDHPAEGQWWDVQDETWSTSMKELAGENIYLTKDGAGADGKAELKVDGTVQPGNVYVEGGEYTLTQKQQVGGGGINMGGQGLLVVQEGAVLNLNLASTSLPMVIVEGKLGLGNAGALPTGTELRLNKEGTLSYTVAGATQDVSEMVSAKSKSTALHIEVGKGVGVTWGTDVPDPGKNNGLKLALDGGTVKSGEGNFTLEWADAATHAGKQEVKAGSLTLEAGGKSVLSGEAVVTDGASLVLKAKAATDALTYAGTVTGGGTLEVAQGAVTLSGNNTVSKITLTGGTTILGSDGGLGGKNTELTLTGGNIQAGKGSQVNAGSVVVERDKVASIVAGSVEITGKVTGRGTLGVHDKAKGTLSGDISEFTGTLDTGTSSWTLSRIAGKVQARVMGNGRLVANSKEEITLTGQLGADGNEVTLQNDGSGDLVIATSREYDVGSGTKLQTSGSGDIVLGNAGTHVVLGNPGDDKTGNEGAADASPWSFGAVTGEGSVVLANVTLPNAGVFGGLSSKTKLTVRTAQGGRVDVAGMKAGELDGITVNEHGLLSGAVGTYTVGGNKGLELHFTDENWAKWEEGMDTSKLGYLIGEEPAADSPQTVAAEGTAGEETQERLSINRGDGTGLELAFDASVLKDGVKNDMTTFYVHALDGDTAEWNASGNKMDVYNALKNSGDQIANVLALAWDKDGKNEFTVDGMVLTVELRNLYLVMKDVGDPHESTSPYELMGKKATVVLDGQTLTLKWAEDGTVNNLVGTEGAQLEIRNTATADRINVTFDNTFYETVTDERPEAGQLQEPEKTAVRGQDTTFLGSITGGEGVDITKAGLGTLTVGGNYTLADGTTSIEGGSLVLGGEENKMKALKFAYQGKAADPDKEVNNNNAEERGLVLDGGHTVLETISDEGSDADGPRVVLQHGAELSLSGESTLSHTDFVGGGEENGSGTVVLEGTETGGGALALTGDASIKDVAVKLNGEKTVLDVGGGNNSLIALNGNGVLRGAAGGNLTISGSDGGTFSGTLDATPGSEVGGKLTVQKGASFTLKNASSTATDKEHGWNVDVQQGGSLTLDLTGKTASSPLVFGNVSVAGDMTMQLDANLGGAPVKGNLTVTDTSTFTVYGTGKHDDTFSLGFSMAADDLDTFRKRLTLDGTAFLADEVGDVKIGDDGTIWITTRLADENRFEIPGAHKNAQAGSAMLWDALRDPNGSLRSMLENPTSGFALIVLDIYDRINRGGDTGGVDRALAAIAGSSISTLGSAVSQDMHRQLTSIRNRTTTMAAEVTQDAYGKLPLWHAWITGETDYHKLDADSFAPGFTLNSWGGTVGVDVDLTPRATAGLAVTAMYGDLKTEDAPDTADGSVDSVYVSTFLRATSGAWVHSLVISAGAADISLDRTISYGGNSYRTSGSTNGYSLGALYEVGYTHIMNKRGTVAVQPVVNVEIRHIGIDGYTETGSDGALRVDDIDQTVVTFGAGARIQAAMGTNAFNRTAVFESRLLAKVDAGDRSGAATTGLKGSNGSAEVESAEVGAFGVEAGAGVSVPLGRNSGSLFLDGSLEFRDGWTSANATLGYRINF